MMNRKKALFVMVPMLGLISGYLFFFWRSRLAFWGIAPPMPAAVLTAVSLGMFLYRFIPIKVRSICVLYLLVFGLLADLADLLLTGPVWALLYGSGAAVFLAAGLTLLWGRIQGKKVICRRYTIPMGGKVKKPLKIGLLSDIHMGLCVSRKKLDRVCAALSEEALDLLLLAGDLCDDQTRREDMEYAIERLGQIPAAQGTFCVLGNHDLGSHGPALQYPEAALYSALAQADIRLLDDTAAVTESCILLGRRDPWMAEVRGGRIPVRELLPDSSPEKPVLVLDHQPYDAREAAQAGADLQLSGHTHGGQIWPASWLGRLSPVFYGRHRFGDMTLIVSSGLGGRGSRLRSGCSAEYVILTLTP